MRNTRFAEAVMALVFAACVLIALALLTSCGAAHEEDAAWTSAKP